MLVFFQTLNVMPGRGKVTLVREWGERERVKVKVCRELNLSGGNETQVGFMYYKLLFNLL